MTLRSPYPWFGGKSRIAPIIWEHLGNVPNYCEPFFGSGACLLSRPKGHFAADVNRIETVNDLDGMVCNFWRSLQAVPDEVAKWADWPVSEPDLHARHLWLTNEGRQHVERLKTEPDYYDAKIAGWWVWGLCQWIGSGWCEQLPHLGNPGRGVHRPSQQRPHLGNKGRGEIYTYFDALSVRLRSVRVCCGDWSRICGPAVTTHLRLTGVILDPPYSQIERDPTLYAVETDVSTKVREWCLEVGSDKRLRIALCGYDGEGHEVLEKKGWSKIAWKTAGGYASKKSGKESPAYANSKRERIWFSPHCLKKQGFGI